MRRLTLPLLGLLLPLSACSDAGLVAIPPPAPPIFDNFLTITGQHCTEPAQDVVFPVKLLFMLDQSASLQCTDQYLKRFDALNATIQDLAANPSVYFGFVGFSARLDILPFTNDINTVQSFVNVAESGAGPATDYQGALATAVRILEEDMVAVGAAERARTRYVVVFLSDGNAEPRCKQGCEDDTNSCSDGEDNDGDGIVDAGDPDCIGVGDNVSHPDSLYGVCNFQGPIEDGDYVDMQGLCPEYNQPPQILQRISDIVELKSIYSVGDVTLNSVLLFNTEEVTDERCVDVSLFGYNKQQAESLLQAMASTGNGTYRDVNLEYGDDSFLSFNFTSLASEQWLTSFITTNLNGRETRGLKLDTDLDGLVDDIEIELKTNKKLRDSDGDGYGDLVEYRLLGSGFDPTDPTLPAITCLDTNDFDGDMLLNCEEDLIGTDDRIVDTDLDGLPDWHELVAGTDPLVGDQFEDLDFDGSLNGDELRSGTDPLVPDEDLYRTDRMRYGLDDLGTKEVPNAGDNNSEMRHCYNFSVEHIRMTTPLYSLERGRNRILIHALERPVDLAATQARAYVACVEAYFNGETDKFPTSGSIDLGPAFWKAETDALATRLQAVADCRGMELTDQDPDIAELRRADVIDTSQECLPSKIVVGDTVFKREDMEDLARKYIRNNLATRFPEHPSHIFVPTELFVAEDHCVRPRELQRLSYYLELVASECAACYGTTMEGNTELGAEVVP